MVIVSPALVNRILASLPIAVVTLTSVAVWLGQISLRCAIKSGLWTLGFVYGVIPAMVYKFPSVINEAIFMTHFMKHSVGFDPMLSGLTGIRNFYVKNADGNVSIGVWHVLPNNLVTKCETMPWDNYYLRALGSGQPIVLYLHGNGGSRTIPHRVDLYEILRNQNYHVICPDYRGYGDSTSTAPTEAGIVSDAKCMIRWVMKHSGMSPVIVWGHSLGTGVSVHALSDLAFDTTARPAALVLEAPFNNMFDAAQSSIMCKPFHFIPGFQSFCRDTLKKLNVSFESDKHIGNIEIPILILHAENDVILPVELGEKLYQAALVTRPLKAKPVYFVKFPQVLNLNHSSIWKFPQLPDLIGYFLKDTFDENELEMDSFIRALIDIRK